MAIRKTTFHRARVLDYWQRSISDDYSMTQAMKDAAAANPLRAPLSDWFLWPLVAGVSCWNGQRAR